MFIHEFQKKSYHRVVSTLHVQNTITMMAHATIITDGLDIDGSGRFTVQFLDDGRYNSLHQEIRDTIVAIMSTDTNVSTAALDFMFILSTCVESQPLLVEEGGVQALVSFVNSSKPGANPFQVEILELATSTMLNLLVCEIDATSTGCWHPFISISLS